MESTSTIQVPPVEPIVYFPNRQERRAILNKPKGYDKQTNLRRRGSR